MASNAKKLMGRALSRLENIVWGVVIGAILIGIVILGYKASRGINPLEYEGKIVDKWAGYSHSDEGSFPYFRLLMETAGGQRSTVAVDPETYNRAKVGMRIRKTKEGIELGSLTASPPP